MLAKQAIVNNFAPLLFVALSAEYGLSLAKITAITTMNFGVQLSVDLLSVKVIDKLGYRRSILIVEACPTEGKEAAMSLLHSFYCWGQLAVVLLSTLFFSIFGIEKWHILACI